MVRWLEVSERRPLSGSLPSPSAGPSRRRTSGVRPPKKVTARFRKELLRGAIDENLDLLSDRPLGTTTRERTRRLQKVKRWFFGMAILAAVIVASAGILTSDGPTTLPLQPAGELSVNASGQETTGPRTDTIRTTPDPAAAKLIARTIPLGVRTVAIDPGHGGRDGGTSLQFGLLEKDLTLDLARRLSETLENHGIETVLTRTNDIEVSLAERAERANAARADLFVSIHVNWLPDRSARGFETYYLGPSDDPFLTRLALSENQDSGFTVVDTRRLLDGIYADLRRTESRRLAQFVQGSLFEVLSRENDHVQSRGVMSAPFVVLVATDMPAILAEVACLSNEREARLLAIPSYRRRIADGLAGGILKYAQFAGGETPAQGDQG